MNDAWSCARMHRGSFWPAMILALVEVARFTGLGPHRVHQVPHFIGPGPHQVHRVPRFIAPGLPESQFL